jgi:hypothetical protein
MCWWRAISVAFAPPRFFRTHRRRTEIGLTADVARQLVDELGARIGQPPADG